MAGKTVVVMGPPAFGSPDPDTMKGSMFLGTQPRTVTEVSGASEKSSEGKKKAADWIGEVEATDSQDGLDAVANDYAASGADFKTVAEAIEKKQSELDANDGNSGDGQ